MLVGTGQGTIDPNRHPRATTLVNHKRNANRRTKHTHLAGGQLLDADERPRERAIVDRTNHQAAEQRWREDRQPR
eukprot:11156213-Lingulodinium_polyedra.AAC.1